MPERGPILVAGATGKQGGAVAHRLLDADRSIRVLTRDPSKARPLAERGATVVRGDMTDPASLERALEGAGGVYAMTTFFEGGIEADVQQGKVLADAAEAAGVRRYVFSSVIGATEGTGVPHLESKGLVEEHIRSLDLDWTFLRPVSFMENFLAPGTLDTIRSGTLPLPLLPGVPFQLVAVGDIGAYAAAAFQRDQDFTGETVPVVSDVRTGPEIAEAWSRRLGRPVAFQPIPLEKLEEIFVPVMGPVLGADLAAMYRWFNERDVPSTDVAANAARWGIPPTSLDAWLDGLDRLDRLEDTP